MLWPRRPTVRDLTSGSVDTNEGPSGERDLQSVSRRSDFEKRYELVTSLASQAGVRAMCLDETMTWCELAPELIELDVVAYDDGAGGRAIPLARIDEHDQQTALVSLMRARSHGVSEAVIHLDGGDEELVIRGVNMLAEWGVIVLFVGGEIDHLPEHDEDSLERRLPRRLVHHRDAMGHSLWVDEKTQQLLGWAHEEMIGRSAIQFVHPADRERAMAGWVDMLAGRPLERSRVRYETAAGDRRWLEVSTTNLLDDPAAGYVEVELIDVHDEMMALSAAKFGEAQFDALTESLPVGVIQVDAHRDVAYANKWIRDLTGADSRESTYHDGIVAEDRDAVDRAFDRAISAGTSTDVEARLISVSTGDHHVCRLRIRPLGSDDDGDSRGAIASIEDVTETRELHSLLHAQVRTDGLTGITNRLGLNEWLVDHLVEDIGHGVTLLYFDLDGFKDVNDRHGHAAGDQLLQAIATAIDLAVESGDLVARIGGDEFVVARPELIDDEQCADLAQRLLDHVERDIELDDVTLSISCSIGIARTDRPDGGPLALADADHAMYHAKRNGGKRWSIYTATLDADT